MTPYDHIHDFNFLFGEWNVEHRRLKDRLVNATEWEHFTGTCTAWPILDGAGNVDDNLLRLPSGSYRAIAMRSFDPTSQTWAIWWLDGRNPHQLDVPVRGAFGDDGIGVFTAHDTFNGHPIIVRFRWIDSTTETPRWDQAFSTDAGATWEVNWEMNFTRASGHTTVTPYTPKTASPD